LLFCTQRIDVAINEGEEGIDYDAVAKKEHLDVLEKGLRRLQDLFSDVYKEQMYQRVR
jgi:hypothetical protein